MYSIFWAKLGKKFNTKGIDKHPSAAGKSMHISGSRSILSTPELWPSSKSKTAVVWTGTPFGL